MAGRVSAGWFSRFMRRFVLGMRWNGGDKKFAEKLLDLNGRGLNHSARMPSVFAAFAAGARQVARLRPCPFKTERLLVQNENSCNLFSHA
jgi:hypothetical protein